MPANGTGKYQPLDRTIFGIVKAKFSHMKNVTLRKEEQLIKKPDQPKHNCTKIEDLEGIVEIKTDLLSDLLQ